MTSLDQELLKKYIDTLKSGKPNLSTIEDDSIYELMSIKRNGEVTLSAARYEKSSIVIFLGSIRDFVVKFYKEMSPDKVGEMIDEEMNNLIMFCKTPRTRREICEYLGLSSVTYAIQTYIMPLIESGKIKLSIPEKPSSPKQLYFSE